MYSAVCIGACIARELNGDQDLALFGTTSRGCFLKNISGWTVFLTEESPRGPLTINLPPDSIAAIKAVVGKHVPLRSGVFHFSDTLQLSTKDTPRWQADPPIKPILSKNIRHKTAAEAIQLIQERKAPEGLTGILPDSLPLLELPSTASVSNDLFTENLHALISCMDNSVASALENHLAAFLGLGSGLTPSGDDFLLGFFLTLERWGEYLPGSRKYHPGHEIASLAHDKTTHLSASLIACAAQGQADERLILALDSLMTDETCNPASLEGLLTWGSSSGLDALAGMLTASLIAN